MPTNRRQMLPTAGSLALMLTAFMAVSQGQPPAGRGAATRDIEVMKSIISTTLSFENGDQRGRGLYVVGWEASRVEGFYLRGQGAVFMIRVPRFPDFDLSRLDGLESRLARVETNRNRDLMRAQLQLMQAQVEESADRVAMMAERQAEIAELAPFGPDLVFAAPPEPPAPPAPPSPGEERELTEREVSERVATMQKRLKEIKEYQEQAKALADEQRLKLEASLLDVLAHHGDSLTQVDANENINMVLIGSSDSDSFYEDSPEQQSVKVMSVKVSDVRELKAGRINRSEFEARVQKY